MREAFGVAMRDRALRRLLIGMALFTALASPIQELAPVVADRLDAGAGGLGLLLGAMGGGALVGAWLLERLSAGGHAAPPRAADRLASASRRVSGRRPHALVRPRPAGHGVQRRLLDLDVRRHQHRRSSSSRRRLCSGGCSASTSCR